MSLPQAFWISPVGKVEGVGTNHISQIIKDPKKFYLTKDEIEKTYEKNGERMGTEGNAREEIILRVLKSGFHRVRRYKNRWSITVNRLDSKTRRQLSKWAELAKADKSTGGFFPVDIYVSSTDKMVKVSTINNLWYGLFESTTPKKPPAGFSEYLCEFVE